jgi:hypothetical protein
MINKRWLTYFGMLDIKQHSSGKAIWVQGF